MNHVPQARQSVDLDHLQPLRLNDLFHAVWRHRVSALVVTIGLLPVLLLIVYLIPAQYDSYAQLLVRLGRGAVSMDPTASLSPAVSLQDSRSSQVNSVREMLHSRALAQHVVEEVGAARILEPSSTLGKLTRSLGNLIPVGGAATAQGNLSAEQVTAQLEQEVAIMAFQKMLNIHAPPDAYTIDLEVRTEDPFLSRDLLAALIRVYQEHHAVAHRSAGAYDFFAEQAAAAHGRAMAAKEALRAARTQRGMMDVGSAQATLRTLLTQIETDLVLVENELAAAGSEIQRLASQIEAAPLTIESEVIRGIPKTTGSTMRQSLYDLEVRYNELAAKYKDDHPKLRALREQLDASSQIAYDEQGDQPQTREAINPIRQSLELTHRQTLTRLAGLESKRDKLRSQRTALLVDLEQLNHDEVDMTELNWEASLAEQEYLRAAEARDNAKMIDELASGRVSEIAVVQEASLGLKKVKPRRGILAVLMACLAAGLGGFQALARGLLLDSPPAPASRLHAAATPHTQRFDPSHTDSRQRSEFDHEDGSGEKVAATSEASASPKEFAEASSVPGVPR